MADAAWENRGGDNCVECGVAAHASELDGLGWCAACVHAFRHVCGCCGERVDDPAKLTDRNNSGELLCVQCCTDLDEQESEHRAEDFYGAEQRRAAS